MSKHPVSYGFILAAGLGTRLRPLTDAQPKPMVKVQGRPMIDHALDKLAAAGVAQTCVNTHYMAEILESHLAKRQASPAISISYEDTLLDTGGGIVKAMQGPAPKLKHHDFFVLSGDSVWEDDAKAPALQALKKAWNPEIMDILILLQDVASMKLTKGVGDYDLNEKGQALRSLDKTGRYMFTSIRINAPHIFSPHMTRTDPFSYLELLDEAQKKGRLYGLVHQGAWHHISTPEDLAAVEAGGK